MTATKTASIYAVIGTDDVEVKRVAKELSVKLGATGDFGADIIDGQVENSEQAAQRVYQAIEAVQTFGFFGGEKLVWLKNVNFLADDRTSCAAATIEAVEKLTKVLSDGMPEGTKFLLSAGAVDKRRSFFKTLNKAAEVQIFDKLDNTKSGWEGAAEALVRTAARARRLEFDEVSLELFTLFTGGDKRTIESELDKLDLFLGKERRKVVEADVRLNTPLSRDGIIFELGNALAARQLQRALELLRQLLFQGESAIGILLATIIPTVRNLLLVKDLMSRHKNLRPPAQAFYFGKDLEKLGEAAIAHLPRTKEGKLNAFPLGNAAQNARHYKMPELQSALRACLEANISLVSSSTEAEVVLSQLLVRIIAA